MVQVLDPITFTVPRGVLSEILRLSDEFNDRMHELLERNTDGNLDAAEKSELEGLVRMAEFTQIVSAALGSPKIK